MKEKFAHFKAPPAEKQEDGTPVVAEDEAEQHEEAIRCLKISPDGKTLASGDVDGNIRIYDLTTPDDIKLVKKLEAHDKEIICLAFSPSFVPATDPNQRYWLASGSRDKCISVFDSAQSYAALGVLAQHTSTVTGIHFRELTRGRQTAVNLITSGADRVLSTQEVDS